MKKQTGKLKYSVYLALTVIFFHSCSPKYGAHFQKTNYDTSPILSVESTQFSQQEPQDNWSNITASIDDNVLESPVIQIVQEHVKKIEQIELNSVNEKEAKREVKASNKDFRKELKAEFKKEIRRAKEAGDGDYTLMMILGILIAPLGVGLTYGIGPEFWISLILFLLFWLPGAIYGGIKVHQFFKG